MKSSYIKGKVKYIEATWNKDSGQKIGEWKFGFKDKQDQLIGFITIQSNFHSFEGAHTKVTIPDGKDLVGIEIQHENGWWK